MEKIGSKLFSFSWMDVCSQHDFHGEKVEPLTESLHRPLGSRREELFSTHHVCFRPTDFIQMGLQCLLVQRISELRPSPYLKMALIDLEIYEPNEILPGAFSRFSRWLPQTLNRVSVFRMLDLEPLFCSAPRSLLPVAQQHPGSTRPKSTPSPR